MKITHDVCRFAATRNYITLATECISLDYHGVVEISLYAHPADFLFSRRVHQRRAKNYASSVLKLKRETRRGHGFQLAYIIVKRGRRFMTDVRIAISNGYRAAHKRASPSRELTVAYDAIIMPSIIENIFYNFRNEQQQPRSSHDKVVALQTKVCFNMQSRSVCYFKSEIEGGYKVIQF